MDPDDYEALMLDVARAEHEYPDDDTEELRRRCCTECARHDMDGFDRAAIWMAGDVSMCEWCLYHFDGKLPQWGVWF